MSLRVLRPGMLTVQDLGRHGLQRHGIVVGGAMDTLSLRIANLLVGNDENAASLEITLLGPSLLFERDSLIAICGGDLAPRVADAPVPRDRPVLIRAGTSITFGGAKQGCRAYLAIAGGVDVPLVLGSRSTYLRAGLGGYEGRALQTGDTLPFGVPSSAAERMQSRLAEQHSGAIASVPWRAGVSVGLAPNPQIQAIRGSEFDRLTAESQQRFWSDELVVSPESDRMGYRLSGTDLALADSSELISAAVCPGTIQLPPSGQPIVLMVDCATTGGYAKVAHVARVDLPRIAQLKPGDAFRLREIPLAAAHQQSRRSEEALRCLKASLKLKLNS